MNEGEGLRPQGLNGVNEGEHVEGKSFTKYDQVVSLIRDGHNVLLVGSGGTGKSYIIKELSKYLESNHLFCMCKYGNSRTKCQWNDNS